MDLILNCPDIPCENQTKFEYLAEYNNYFCQFCFNIFLIYSIAGQAGYPAVY